MAESPNLSTALITTSLVAFFSGFALGIYSIRGYIVPPALKSARKRTLNDPVESEESDIDEGDTILDHAPNWANGAEADRRQGLRVAEGEANQKNERKNKNQKGKEVEDNTGSRGDEAKERSAKRDAETAHPRQGAVNTGSNPNEECKLVLVVRTDLGMTKACYKTLSRSASRQPTSAEAKIENKAKEQLSKGFVSLLLKDVEVINHNTKKFIFHLPEDDMVSGMHVASALLTKFVPEGQKPVIRPYTPTSDESKQGYIELIVKKYPGGPMSTHLHDMVPGQRLDFKGPLPKYPWTPNKHEHIALVAGGTGITPMYQLIRAIFNNPDDKTKVTLVFGNVTEEDILLKRELADIENTYPQRFRAFYVLDNPPKEWAGNKGFITKDLLKTVLPEPKESNIKIFVCGPPGLYKAISGTKVSPKDQGELSGILKELGYSQDQVYKF
ncbi:hypothetical protein NUW58_g9182 [Xylaria curta]|uniref:Uncharacterized protein n=1 Tax=Xylaria curta TaxID=42375 RepID=A0ACC1N1X0_9PEZI|nr:hypothetical protein NUW58_g9182 [Xylaria curta]